MVVNNNLRIFTVIDMYLLFVFFNIDNPGPSKFVNFSDAIEATLQICAERSYLKPMSQATKVI